MPNGFFISKESVFAVGHVSGMVSLIVMHRILLEVLLVLQLLEMQLKRQTRINPKLS